MMMYKKRTVLWAIFLFALAITACNRGSQSAGSPLASKSSLPTPPSLAGAEEVIIFMSNRDGGERLYTMAPDGTNVQMVHLGGMPQNALIDRPVWSHALNKFLLSATVGSDSDIYLVNRDGSDLVNLTNTPLQVEAHPAPSPDGGYIAFVAVESDLDIFVMRSDGSGRLNLTYHPAREVSPQWSPDSMQILFSSNRGGTPNIFIVNRDGSGLTNLSKGPGQDSSFSWSPDSHQILFESDRDGNMEIYVMDADGQNVANLTNHPSQDVEPLWSPDGRMIAFLSDRNGGRDICVMQANGTSVVNLTNSPEVEELGVSWAPNSQHLVYVARGVSDKLDVFVVGADGSPPINLTNHPADDYAPLWVRF